MAGKSKVHCQDWFYHSPAEPKQTSQKAIPVPSQIPGLSDVHVLAEDEQQHTRKWIRDTDTEYVKLAKSGGRKDLFRYREHNSGAKPVLYPRVDWFDHDAPMESTYESVTVKLENFPEWFGHEEYVRDDEEKIAGGRRPFLGFDGLSIWKREEEDNRLPSIAKKKKTRKSKSGTYDKEETKFPTILTRGGRKKSIDNSDMGELMSFSYQKEFINDIKERKIENKKKKKEEQKMLKDKLENKREIYIRQKKANTVPDKPLFKLSKFGNVPSRVDSHRT